MEQKYLYKFWIEVERIKVDDQLAEDESGDHEQGPDFGVEPEKFTEMVIDRRRS